MTNSLRIRSLGLLALAAAALAGPLAGVAQAAPPTTRTPALAITGTSVQGDTLQSNGGDATAWDGTASLTIADQWFDCPAAVTVGCTAIAGATQTSYQLGSSDLNQYVYLAETASNTEGPATTNSGFIGPVTAPPPPPPVSSGQPTITGNTQQGQSLQEAHATWSNSPSSYTYQWQDCDANGANCADISGATNQTYTLVAADVGHTIVVKETASNASGPGAADPSAATAVVTGVPISSGPPTITGNTQQGQSLQEAHASWSNSPSGYAYQWQDCDANGVNCADISGATNQTYTLVAADVGHTIVVKETASNASGPGAADPSTATAVVTGVPISSAGPTITGTTWQGQTLSEGHASWSNSPTSYTYQWQRCDANGVNCADISGATSQTYTLVAADVGSTIVVKEIATNPVGPAATAAVSTATPVITLPPPGVIASPSISGTAQQGMTLTEVAAHWSNSPTSITITWYRCDSNGSSCKANGTGATYPLTADDLGALIQVSETASNASNVPVTAVSSYAGPVASPAGHVDPPTVKAGSQPVISGVAQLGRTLTGSGAQFDGNPGNFNYQWLRCNALGCSSIPGETNLTYTPTSADVGDSIAFAETAGNSGGTSAPVQSARTDTITAPSTTTLQTNSAGPVAGQTVTLIATVTSAAGSVKPAGTVDFQSNGAPILGCTGIALGTAAPTAVCQTAFRASVANVTAAYSAAAGTFITGSTSSPTSLTVGRAVTSVTVAASAHVSLGAKTTYTATVHSPAGDSLTPTGRVTFTDGGKTIKGCGSKALAASRAPCSVKYLGIKQHRISVRYGGDANFAPSASLTSHVLVQPQAPSGFVAVFMNWSFRFNLHATQIAFLQTTGLSAGIHITVSCSGGGCPFAHRAMTVFARGKCGKPAKKGCVAAPSFNLASMFHRARLDVGTKVAVAVTHRGWVGKYYRFTIRKGRKPVIDVSCLAVNGTRPGVGCSAR